MLSYFCLTDVHCMLQALLTAQQLALAAKQPWLVANAAITLFNTYLPQMRHHNYAALSGVLQQAQAGLLQLQPAEVDPALLISLTCSMAAAVEHSCLLAVLGAAGEGQASAEDGSEDNAACQGPGEGE